jgi:hypothetical protein
LVIRKKVEKLLRIAVSRKVAKYAKKDNGSGSWYLDAKKLKQTLVFHFGLTLTNLTGLVLTLRLCARIFFP